MSGQLPRKHTPVHGAIHAVVRTLVGAGALAMVILLIIQVVGRYALGHSFSWTEEAARYVMIWTAMLGASLAASSDAGLSAFTLLRDRRGRTGRVFSLISASATGVFLLLLIYAGILYTSGNANHASPGLGISKAWAYAALPVGALLLIPGTVAIARPPRHDEGGLDGTSSLPVEATTGNGEGGAESK